MANALHVSRRPPAEAMEQDVGAGERDSGARVPQAEDTALLGESPK